MAIKFSQFNLRTDHTSGMYLVGYDGNQNIHITVDNLFDDFINGTENTIAMFGTGGTALADSILSQDAGATLLTVAGQLNVDAAATFDTSVTVTGDSTLNGNVTLGDASTDLITQTGTLYLNGPIKDTTDTLGAVDQILVSDAAGELTFQNLLDTTVGSSEVVRVPVKNTQGSPLAKGDPVYISGSVGASGRLEVQLADSSNSAKMPAVGLLFQNLANNEEGYVVITGKLRNIINSPIDGVTPTEGDIIYVKPSGISGAALTTTKPVYGNFIQNVGKVGRVSTNSDGTFVVSSILRSNDIPNLTPGKIWVGSTGNTIESSSITFTEATGAVQLNQYGSGTITGTAAYNLSVDSSGNVIEMPNPVNSWAITADTGNSQTVLNGDIVDIAGGTYISTVVGATDTVTVNHDATIRTDTTSSVLPGVGGNFTAVDSVTTNSTGHVTGLNLKTVTLPDDGIDGSGTLNYVAKFTPDGDTIGDSVIYDDGTDVGIGTTDPQKKLVISETTNATIRINSTKNGSWTAEEGLGHLEFFGNDTSGEGAAVKAKISATSKDTFGSAFNMTFGTTNGVNGISERMRIRYDGNVGINQTDPSRLLHVAADSSTAIVTLQRTNTNTTGGLGALQWTASDDHSVASISVVGDGNNEGGHMDFRTTSAATNNDPYSNSYLPVRMRIDSSGNVGIGTTSPSKPLHINGGTLDAVALFESSDAKSGIEFKDNSTVNPIGIFAEGDNATLYTGNAERMRIDSSGNVGIGTTSPASKLDVNGGIRMADDSSTASASNVGTLRYRTSGNNSYVDMCMQTGASTYAWVNIVQNNW